MNQHATPVEEDPFVILGLDHNASESEVRRRYLELVKQHPPETDPARFREIHAAYESARDPLIRAERLVMPSTRMPEWSEVLEQQKRNPPLLSAKTLLALGNQPEPDKAND